MGNLQGFNASQYGERDDFSPIPDGIYTVAVMDSQNKKTKDGQNEYLEFTFQVTEGEYEGRKLWDRINIFHNKPQVVEIAQKTLAELVRACGKTAINDSEELHGHTVEAKVVLKPAKDGFQASNEIKKYQPSGSAGNSAAPPSTSQVGSAGKLPWQK